MATTKKSGSGAKAATKAKPAPEPKGPSYEDLLSARHRMNDAHAAVTQAERELRSARSINTTAHREERVALALESLTEARMEASEATIAFESAKLAGGGR